MTQSYTYSNIIMETLFIGTNSPACSQVKACHTKQCCLSRARTKAFFEINKYVIEY